MDYVLVKWVHIVSATLIFGTGIGSAFYLFFTHRTRDVRAIAVVARQVVLADWIFTAPAIALQPLTGAYLMQRAGIPWDAPWIVWTLALYVLAGVCWLPVVWLQIRMRELARAAVIANGPLPPLYWRYAHLWLLLGVPAFTGMLVIFYLMVAKPV